ncbi:MAG: CusA/CzcA family heavy metal efflux RND transporter [Saprospiraceae bacterium]|nr:CusA/CzcA family heavy metal efflux RND transporter [Saprospiraceae bacterium]
MIDRIIRFSIEHKLIVGLLVSAMVGWGIYSLQHLPIDAVPDITDNQVQVITNAPTLATQEVEQYITFPLEMALGNIPNVIEIRSVSRFGLSVITVVFTEQMDTYLARQLIDERIKAVQDELPRGLGKPEMGPITTGLGEIYQYVIHPAEGYESEYSAMELRSIQDWLVKRQLVGLEGVIEVNSSGGYLKQYEIAVDPDKLKSMNLSLAQLYEAVERNNANTGGSYIEKKHYTYFIRSEGLLKNIEDIEQTVIESRDGQPILIKDVAQVKYGNAPRFGAVTMNGKGEVVAGQIMMLKGANAAEVTRRIKERMVQIEASLPEGVVIEPYLDRSKLVQRTTKTVITNLIEGGLIVIFVLVLLLGNLRAGLIVASVIPLAMLFAISMMRVFGVSANLMSLGAIDFGLIVDGAVIIVEAILHHLSLGRNSKALSTQEMNQEVATAATKIRKSAAFGEIIILIVYLPILFLTGIEGKMFKPMAQTVSFAILGALLLSLTYVPMMAALFLQRQQLSRRTIADKIMEFLQRGYQPILRFSLRFKRSMLVIALLLLTGSLWLFSRMGGEFIPTLEEGDFALHQILPPGSSLQQGVEVSAPLQNILLENFPEVEKVVTKIGTAEIPTDIMPLEAGDIFVILKPKAKWTSAKTKEGLFAKMEMELNKFPGVIYEFTQPIQMRFNELMTGIRQDIAIKIYGEDIGLLAMKAKEAEAMIEGISGVGDLQVEATAGLQQMIVTYDRAKLAKYGLDVATINTIIRTAFAGGKTGVIFEGEKRFDLVVRLDEAFRQNIDHIKNLYVPLSNGQQIPLYEVADVSFQEGPTQISRDNTQRRITIGVNARERNIEQLVEEIQETLSQKLELPAGYYLTYGGQFENFERARARLMVAVPIALGLIFILLFLTFGSIKQALLIYTAIPLSAIGGIWALYFRGMPFSISAGVGFIALFGVAVLNGIVLIAYFNRLKQEENLTVMERIHKGTRIRLRPVVMTAAVASLGFLPMAISTSAGAEVQQPLATVVIGGLITATLLTLIILPILYYYAEKDWRWSPKSSLLIIGFLALGYTASAQSNPVSLEEAQQIAIEKYPSLVANRLQIQKGEQLSQLPAYHPRANVFISGEESNFSGMQGIESFTVQQYFNLPKTAKRLRAWYAAQALVAKAELQRSETALKGSVAFAYYDVLYYRQKLDLLEEQSALYETFEQLSQDLKDAGEKGKIPLLKARGKRQESSLAIQQAEADYQIMLQQLNQWLLGENYEPNSTQLPTPNRGTPEQGLDLHPQLLLIQQQQQLAERQVAVIESQNYPQLNTGLSLQRVNGDFLFYGFQFGVNVPLFKQATKKRAEAMAVDIAVQGARAESTRLQLANKREKLAKQRLRQLETMDYIEQRLLPQAEEQQALLLEAYRQGEAAYFEYVQGIESLIRYKLQHLDALYKYHWIENQLQYLLIE